MVAAFQHIPALPEMNRSRRHCDFGWRCALAATVLLLWGVLAPPARAQADPLPSWNEGAAKRAITAFVAAVTADGTPDYVPREERIAVFDNDGTLWPEQPIYVQLAFALDRVHDLAPQHPEWRQQQPFEAVLEGDMKTLAAVDEKGAVDLVMATHTGMTVSAFAGIVKAWFATARHPRFKRPYQSLAYQPMTELLAYLRASGFKTYIVSGGGIDFMRPVAEAMYGIPPEQVIGSSVRTVFTLVDGRPALVRDPAVDFVDDNAGKPVAIERFIGRRPLAAFGNSDGDLEMLQWTTGGAGRRLALLVHHTDGEREYAYDRDSATGRLDKALDMAQAEGWVIVDMKADWKSVFTSEPAASGSTVPNRERR
jgi:phosphoglycolate phosphatase-like HAD superfamily hydrolase